MTLRVRCPACKNELAAPKEMVGQLVACPQCSHQFVVSEGGQGSAPAAPPPPPPESASTSSANFAFPPGAEPPGTAKSAAPTATTSTAPSPQLPPQTSSPPTGTSTTASASSPPSRAPSGTPTPRTPTPGTPTSGTPTSRTPAPRTPAPRTETPEQQRTAPPTESHKNPAAFPPQSTVARASTPPAKSKRPKFISADPTAARIQLGADGQLPNLELTEQVKKDVEVEDAPQSNSSLIVVVLCISIGMSLIMLFVDTSATKTEAQNRSEARQKILDYYMDEEEPIPAYQRLLREAQRAHSRGDSDEERKRYRRVLDMLHAESNNNNIKGLTGVVDADSPPNDRDLREILSLLIRKD